MTTAADDEQGPAEGVSAFLAAHLKDLTDDFAA